MIDLIKQPFGYISAKADANNDFHVFLEHSSKSGDLLHIKIHLDPKLALHMKSPVDTLTGLLKATAGTQTWLTEQPLKIEYIPSTPLQAQGLRIQTASDDVWTQVDTDSSLDASQFWSPLEHLIQENQYGQSAAFQKQLRTVDIKEEVRPGSILKNLSYTHEVGGQFYGKEDAKQFPMLSKYIEVARVQIECLRALQITQILPDAALTQMQIDFLEEKLQVAEETYAKTGNEMVDSNYFRDLMKEATKEVANGRSKSELTEADFDEIYRLTCERFIPSLCNCWQQGIQAQHPNTAGANVAEHQSWMRTGAFYDTRCGLFSSLDFFDSATGGLKDDADLEAEGKKLLKKIADYDKQINEKKGWRSGVFFRKKKYKQSAIWGCQSAIKWITSRIAEDNGDIKLEGLKRVLMERKAIQETSFLSLLETQVGRLKPGDDKLQWLHVSLLKPFEEWKGEDISHSSGWTHNEKHEMLEMQWAFRHFRGAKIVFQDVEATSITYEINGKPKEIIFPVHLAPAGYQGEAIDLESHFVNCSVAAGVSSEGHKNAKGAAQQADANQDFFQYAYKEHLLTDRSGEPLCEQDDPIACLAQGKSSFTAAEELSSFLLGKGWAISGCCQSGKDRTGFWCSRLAQRQVLDHYDAHALADEDKSIRRCLNENPLVGKRVTTKILQANTGKTAIKVGVIRLPGEDFLMGKRIHHYGTLIYEQVFQKNAAKVQTAVERNFTI